MWRERISITRGDITTQNCDVIVNAANEQLSRGGGVCGAIHAAAGPGLERECRRIGGTATGRAVATGAYDLSCRHIIHAVGPIWHEDSGEQEDELLASCYAESLRLAAELGAESIAFPCISTGIYGFPAERACKVAFGALRDTLPELPDLREVRLVCFSGADFETYEKVFGQIS